MCERMRVCIRATVADSPLTRFNFQPSSAQCEIYLFTTYQGGHGGVGWKVCWKTWGSNRVHNQAKLSSTKCSENHRDRTDSAIYLIKEEPESRQPILQQWKYFHSVLPISSESELNTYVMPLPQPWWRFIC